MKALYLAVAFIVVIFGSLSAFAQCCCSGVVINLTDSGGNSLRASDVKVTEVSERSTGRVHFSDIRSDEAVIGFRIGCGSGKEVMLIEYMGSEMYVHFKLYGEFGSHRADLVFASGRYIAELAKEREDGARRELAFRQPTVDEMTEIERPKDTDAPTVQTDNPF